MRLLFKSLALAAVMAASACTPAIMDTGAPVEIADKTKLDEQGMLSAESLYTAANNLAGLALDVGALNADQRARLKIADNRAYGALLTLRSAYRAGNSSGYFRAVGELTDAVNQINLIVGSR